MSSAANENFGFQDSPGQLLRQYREAAGMSVHDISSRLHLSSRMVEHLETDDYESLPAPAFVRGYLTSYARLLERPTEPVLRAFDEQGLDPPAINDIVESTQAKATDFPMRMATYAIVIVLAMLVILWWQTQRGDTDGTSGEATDATENPISELTSSDSQRTSGEGGEEIPRESEPTFASLEDAEFAPAVSSSRNSAESVPTSSQTNTQAGSGEDGVAAVSQSAATTRASSNEEDNLTANALEALEPSGAGPALENSIEPSRAATGRTAQSPAPTETAATASIAAASTNLADSVSAADSRASVDTPSAPENTVSLSEDNASGSATPLPASDTTTADTTVAISSQAEPTDGLSRAPGNRDGSEDGESTTGSLPAPEFVTRGDPNATGAVSLRFSQESWVEVYDSTEARLYFGLAPPGSALELRGQAPIRVLIGNRNGARVQYNGVDYDLSGFRRNVARFELGG